MKNYPRGSRTLLSSDIAGAVNPLNIGIGLIAGSGASALINKIDPNMPEVPKQALVGGLGNVAGEGAVVVLRYFEPFVQSYYYSGWEGEAS